MDDSLYWHWLCSIEQLSPVKKTRLLRLYSSPEQLYNIEEKQLAALDFLTDREKKQFLDSRNDEKGFRTTYEQMERLGIRLVTLADQEYPDRLLHIFGAPCGLYVKGRLPAPRKKSAAIVGARGCSPYGREMAGQTGRRLAEADIQVISGMAAGIDGAAQWGALETGTAFAVLGCGVDQCYPISNFPLYERLAAEGGLLSEFPPGAKPLSWHFPQRNRLISGLADLVVVIEARKKSGSLITAEHALDQGKDVFALPGRVTDPLSEGCHQLIKNGAGLLSTPEDLLEILAPQWKKPLKKRKEIENGLVLNEKKVYSCLDYHDKSMEDLVEQTGLTVKETARALVQLEIRGLARRAGLNRYTATTEC